MYIFVGFFLKKGERKNSMNPIDTKCVLGGKDKKKSEQKCINININCAVNSKTVNSRKNMNRQKNGDFIKTNTPEVQYPVGKLSKSNEKKTRG